MDQSLSENDISLSPSQLLERLQLLRKLQLLQRGKLQKQQLHYEQSHESSPSLTEIVSHFTSSTSYNTFQSLLQSPNNNATSKVSDHNTSITHKLKDNELMEGVSVLNLSQESECLVNSPLSSRTTSSNDSNRNSVNVQKQVLVSNVNRPKLTNALDEIPILSPKKDFETLMLEKIKNDKASQNTEKGNNKTVPVQNKKTFLKRGEGMARFGLRKNYLIIQNTNSLPWKQKKTVKVKSKQGLASSQHNNKNKNAEKDNIQIHVTVPTPENKTKNNDANFKPNLKSGDPDNNQEFIVSSANEDCNRSKEEKETFVKKKLPLIKSDAKSKHPLLANKGKTWAAILTKEQDDYLKQLKQSNYYKNFTSPAKSIASDYSCDENTERLIKEREIAEQNIFELIEHKVSSDSFNLENSFFHRFLRKSQLECSVESTPLVLQKCLANNPGLLQINSSLNSQQNKHVNIHSDTENYDSEYTECDHETCSSVSTCCSCKTVEETTPMQRKEDRRHIDSGCEIRSNQTTNKKMGSQTQIDTCQKSTSETDIMKADMAEMNAKLIATSDLLKERLKELEDEIETFRKENYNLTKMREEMDMEKQKFYEEKSNFEQKFNEEKILSEYYLAEEKEKLNKQKQMYERYVREMRGRLSKKEKDEVVNLKKEISDLKAEIRLKDAKSTSTIARLRNQLKIIEKEKKSLQDEIEKLKKENRRIQHSNEISRRLTNIKYLEQINKKLTTMTSKDTCSEVDIDNNIKYKAYEIERQSRNKRIQPINKTAMRPRAKSVPNLNVTSRYAKYFSQRDVNSEMENINTVNIERYSSSSDEETENFNRSLNKENSVCDDEVLSDKEVENHLEKLYNERFKSISPQQTRSPLSEHNLSGGHSTHSDRNDNSNGYFLQKSNSNSSSKRPSKSPTLLSVNSLRISTGSCSNSSISPVSILSNKGHNEINRRSFTGTENNFKSAFQAPELPTNSNSSQQSNAQCFRDSSSKTSLAKTNLNPTEIKRPDGTIELRFPNGNVKYIAPSGNYIKFIYYNGDIKESFMDEGRIKYYYAENKTFHTTYPDGLEVIEFPNGQVEKRYKDGSSEIRLPNGSVRYQDPKNQHVREEWRFPDGAVLTLTASGDRRVQFPNGQIEVHTKDHKRREFPDGTVKLLYNDGTSETRYASGRVRIKDKHGNLIMDSAPS